MRLRKQEVIFIKRFLFLFVILECCAFGFVLHKVDSLLHTSVQGAVTASPSAKQKVLTDPLTKITPVDGDFCLDVPILLYHYIKPLPLAEELGHAQLTVDSDWFAKQMRYLREHGYKTIAADDLVSALLTHKELPPKSVVVTIDDGYDDVYDFVYPIAKRYHIIINIMIPTALVGKSNYLSWSELKELSGSDLVRIYNHTTTHAPLTYIEPQEVEKEIVTAQKQLNEKLRNNSHIFSYPYGLFNDDIIALLKKHGYIAAFSTQGGRTQCTGDLMKLYRIHIGNDNLDTYGF
jgi:peptidoglycan/xylan/chitin deacetylase (PgdA/CDA1 family)